MLLKKNCIESSFYILSLEERSLLCEIGFFSMSNGFADLSVKIFKKLCFLCPDEPAGAIGLAMNHLLAGAYTKAEQILISASNRTKNKKDEVLLYLAVCYFSRKKYTEAEKIIHKILNNESLTGSHVDLALAMKRNIRIHPQIIQKNNKEDIL